jgi:hypothetical protein
LGVLIQFRSLPKSLTYPSLSPGEPLPILPTGPVYRHRRVELGSPVESTNAWAGQLATRFTIVTQSRSAPSSEDAAAGAEHRLLGMRRHLALYLRPLLALGLLTALMGLWLAVAFGWQVTSPSIAPGGAFRSVNRGLAVAYLPPDNDEQTLQPEISVLAGGLVHTYTLSNTLRFRAGEAVARVRTTDPALWIRVTSGEPLLARPGQAERTADAGLVFPTPGSEDSLLLPEQAAGLRIVRSADPAEDFILELYRSTDVEPVLRQAITGQTPVLIPLPDEAFSLYVAPLPALQVHVRHLPGQWLVWTGLVLALIGLPSLIRPPIFALAQVAPWPMDQSVVVLQSSSRNELAALLKGGMPATAPANHAELASSQPES